MLFEHCVGHASDVGVSALSLVAFVCSEAVVGEDAATVSLACLREGGRFMRLVRTLFTEDKAALARALSACDAACTATYENACALRDGRVLKKLEKYAKGLTTLAADGEEAASLKKQIGRFVRKVKLAIERGEKLSAIAAKWQARAAGVMQSAVKEWIARRRRERLLKEAQAAASVAKEVSGGMRAMDDDDDDESEEDDYIDDFDEDFDDE